MAMKRTPEIEAAMRAAGIPPASAKGKAKRAVKPLPAHCLLLPGPSRGREEVTIHGWHPTRLNVLKGVHWAQEGRLKYSDACILGGELRRAGVPRAAGKRRVGLVIVLGPGQRGGDGDSYWKSALDGMKRCGALKDDNRQWLEIVPVQYERQSVMSTRIIIEDL